MMRLQVVFLVLFFLLGAYMVSALVEAAIPVVTILTPPDGANLTISNGTTTSIVVIVNVSANSTTNITNVTVFLMNAANGTIATIGSNASINASDGNQTFNFTIVNANISGQSDGIRNYSINAYATTAVSNGTLVNAIANISKVNISIDNTAPTVTQNSPANATNQTGLSVTFSFTATDNNYTLEIEEWYNLTCTVYSGHDNRTTINNTYRSGNASTVTNTSMAQKLHKWKVQCVDAFGIGENSSIRDLIIDATAPLNANMTVSAAKINFRASVTLTCAGSDAISNDSNASLYIQPAGLNGQRLLLANFTNNNVTTKYTETRTLGLYEVNCSIVDRAGNQNSTTITFEVIRAASGSDLPAAIIQRGKERVATIVIAKGATSNVGAIEGKEESRLMGSGSTATFTIGGESHSFIVKEVSDSSVTIVIQSDPQEATIQKGQTQEFDVNDDGFNDVRVTYHGSDLKDRADMTIEGLEQPEEGETPPGEETPEPATPSAGAGSATTNIILILFFFVFFFGFFFFYR